MSPNPEFPYFTADLPSSDLRRRVQAINGVTHAFTALETWAGILNVSELRDQVPVARELTENSGVLLSRASLEVRERSAAQVDKLARELLSKAGGSWPNFRPNEPVDTNTAARLSEVAIMYRGFYHSTHNELGTLAGNLEHVTDYQGEINHGLVARTSADIVGIFTTARQALVARFEHNPFTLGELARSTTEHLGHRLEPYGITVAQRNNSKNQDMVVDWSKAWRDILLENIASNALKVKEIIGHDEQLLIIVGTGSQRVKGQIYGALDITDTGVGWPTEILEHGFQEEVSGFRDMGLEGHGYGLSFDARIFAEQYGGRFIPSNPKNWGARLTLGFPPQA